MSKDEDEVIKITRSELISTIEIAVLKEKYIDLKEDVDTHIIAYNMQLQKIFAKIESWPMDMVRCKKELYNEVEKGFVTKPELKIFEKDIFGKLDMIKSRVTWTVATIIAIASIAQYILITWTLIK